MSTLASRLAARVVFRFRPHRESGAWLAVFTALAWAGFANLAAAQLTTLFIEDYATMPITGSTAFPSSTANSAYLARANFMAEEPGGGDRFFVNDLNGPLYTLDKSTRQFTPYLNFNGRDGATGMFDKFTFSGGFANGLITFQFDPDYGNNGKFYTVHMEEPGVAGSQIPDNSSFPGLDTSGYVPTPSVDAPGSTNRHTVLIEWTDTNIGNNTFEGTAREVLRLDMVSRIHPLGDLIFNPLAGPGDPDWRVMYLAVGDGGAGEQGGSTRMTPQRLDTLAGKILRIIPDLNEHTETSTVSPNGQYRIPDDNPYTSIDNSAVRDEIFAAGLRNPHRITWDVDPEDPSNNHIIVSDIGLHTWEEVNLIYPGMNYGYSQREGNELLQSNNSTTSLPNPDIIPIQITDTTTAGTITPTYPVVQYGHDFSDSQYIGDSISSGYVYRGSRIPELYGKFLFGEITTGQMFYADYAEMLAADDGDPSTMAEIHSLNILWDDPNDAPDQGVQEYTTEPADGPVLGPMWHVVRRAYAARGGQDPNLPGSAAVTSGNGRTDIRIQIDEAGELYILSKSDGMIRAIVSSSLPALVMTVDRRTGAVSIRNAGQGPLSFDEYSILSASGSLDPADGAWNSLTDQGVSNWQEDAATPTELSEVNALTALQLAGGASRSLGNPYAPAYTQFGAPAPADVQFSYTSPQGLISGVVEYVGVDANNNLVLTVDPATGNARLTNTSPFEVSIDGYSILSDSGALEPADGDWLSFADRGLSGWTEAAPTATELSELIPEGEMLLASGAAFAMGRLFDPAGAQDLTLEFIIAQQELPSIGVVLFESFALPGDYNGNGTVDAADYVVWRKTFGQTVPAFSGADGDGNGTIDQEDYAVWRSHFGNTAPGTGANLDGAPVPEPNAALLAAFAAAFCGLSALSRRGRDCVRVVCSLREQKTLSRSERTTLWASF